MIEACLVTRIDGRSGHRKDIREPCSLFVAGLCFSVSHHITFSPGIMVDIFLCLLMCLGIQRALVCVRVLIPLALRPYCISLSPAFARSNFPPLSVLCASCVLLHSFSLYCLSWDKSASFFSLVMLTINTLTKDGAIVSLTLASPLASDGMHKRFCQFLLCRVGGDDVSTL